MCKGRNNVRICVNVEAIILQTVPIIIIWKTKIKIPLVKSEHWKTVLWKLKESNGSQSMLYYSEGAQGY